MAKTGELNWKMSQGSLCLAVFLITITPSVDTARILGAFSMPAPSHHIIFQALMRELAERGHEVVVASPFPLPEPKPTNYTEVFIPVSMGDIGDMMKVIISPQRTPMNEHLWLWSKSAYVCESQLSHPTLKNYLAENSKTSNVSFDLVIVEGFFMDCMVGFAHIFNAPLVVMVTQYGIPWADDMAGVPDALAHVPHVFLPYSQNMNFLQRLHNTAFSIFTKLYRRYVSLPQQNEIAKKYFGHSMPPLWELEQNASLIFTNGNPTLTPIRPTLPNYVEIGGIHIQPNPPPLPQDLQEYMERHKRVILFSLGSLISNHNIPKDRLREIMEFFVIMDDYHFIWRWNGDKESLPLKIPPNVFLSEWLPQQSILAHRHLVAFITHGGLLSMLEAAYHSVPLIAFPFYGDQKMNVKQAEEIGLAVKLDFFKFTKTELEDAVRKVLMNQSHISKVKEISRIFRDQKESPLERAVFWTEYVIRHKGAPHLRASSTKLSWYEYYLLDVMLVMSLATSLAITLMYKLSLFIVHIFPFPKISKSVKMD
ncbi:UDP-glucosyltransferase 2-like [Hetaerina americana]|uniref:UDP-glucosyltransferase 2-like n=1 Tax=Hetaerina americana TaxID=62018 RepID=UPI003A7F2641